MSAGIRIGFLADLEPLIAMMDCLNRMKEILHLSQVITLRFDRGAIPIRLTPVVIACDKEAFMQHQYIYELTVL